MAAQTRSLVAFAHVADVERSIRFYADLGFEVGNRVRSDDVRSDDVQSDEVPPEGGAMTVWAWLHSEKANLMVGLADEPVDPQRQAVLFYLYFDDIQATRDALVGLGHAPGAICHPFYMPGGECRLLDPDGYVLMLAQI
jgi:catechol 2,3-dioxygenase-like lactoylglutathione lyase family enzyme